MRDCPEKGCFSAVRFPDDKQTHKRLLQDIPKHFRQYDVFLPRNAEIQRAELLQYNTLFRMFQKLSADTNTASAGQNDVPERNFTLMAMDGTAAEGIENLFHLKLVQFQGYDGLFDRNRFGQFPECIGFAVHCHQQLTACPQANFVDAFCLLDGKLHQRPCQPRRQAPHSVIILVHFASPFVLASCHHCMQEWTD